MGCSKFINTVMKKGDRLTARGLVEQAFVKVKQVQLAKYRSASDDAERAEIELDPTVILRRAIENCKPLLQLTPIKRGGSTYQVPYRLSIGWCILLRVTSYITQCSDR